MQDKPKYFLQHLRELRQRIFIVAAVFIVAFGIFYKNVQFLMDMIFYPLKKSAVFNGEIIYTNLPEVFLNEINLAIFFALLFTLPILMLQAWLFLKPALYECELMVTRWIFLIIPALFYSGVAFVQVLVMPKAVDFFVTFEKSARLKFMPKLSEYISFCEKFMLVFGIGFELPVLLCAMVAFNLINLETLKKRWRIVVLCIFLVSAVITPPDALSMLALALPLIVLYIVTIVMIDYSQRRMISKGEVHA